MSADAALRTPVRVTPEVSPMRPQISVVERLLAKVDFDGPLPEHHPELGQCWIWTASHYRDGYGAFGVGRKVRAAHIVSYILLIGEVPDGLQLDHLCRNRGCPNPWHLEPVTHIENIRRGDAGGYLKRRTHCPQGHEYTPDNSIHLPNGTKNCRECHRARCRDYMRRKRQGRLVT